MIPVRFRWTHVLMALHVEPYFQTYRLVPRWRAHQYARGGWCRWDRARLDPRRGRVPTIREARLRHLAARLSDG